MTTEQLAKDLLAIIDSEMYVNDFGGLQAGRDATTDMHAAMGRLEAALAKPITQDIPQIPQTDSSNKQEPSCKNCRIDRPCSAKGKDLDVCSAYVPPPEHRTWVGLTNEEHIQVAMNAGCMSADWLSYGAAVELALKEKNT